MDKKNCDHSITIKGLCAVCGKDLEKFEIHQTTSVSMVHAVPELRVTEEYAKEIGKDDQSRLIRERKLVLVVDLDQTILHTTHDKVNDQNVYKFCLWPGHPTYHTKLRPFLDVFLERMCKLFELHIFTFGCRRYAHKIADIVDPSKKYFSHRILSRDESVDQMSKRGNLKDLFPCGDSMVCIIDDRDDVWNYAKNLIRVRPYVYFKSTGDINSPYAKSESNVSGSADTEKSEDQKECDVINEDDTASDSSSSLDFGDDDDESLKNTSDELTKKLLDSDDNPEPDEDLDDYLLLLAARLEEIHDKFYDEYDERVRYLADGEQYKLPDLKDIIPMVLKRYTRGRH